MLRFQELVSAAIKSFESRCITVDEIVSAVITLGAFKPVIKEPQLPALRHCLGELKAAKSINDAFMVLKDYFSFFNYHIIEHIIKQLGTEEDKAELQRYKDNFNWYAKRRIFECPPEFGAVIDAGNADLFVKVDSKYENCTVEEIDKFCHKLSEILCVTQGILRLCRVEEGCVQLMLQVPTLVQQEIFPLSRQQEKHLMAVGVIRLRCGKYQFLDPAKNGTNSKLVHVGISGNALHDPSHLT